MSVGGYNHSRMNYIQCLRNSFKVMQDYFHLRQELCNYILNHCLQHLFTQCRSQHLPTSLSSRSYWGLQVDEPRSYFSHSEYAHRHNIITPLYVPHTTFCYIGSSLKMQSKNSYTLPMCRLGYLPLL